MTMQGNNPPAAGALLSARAMLATVSISQWNGRKKDKAITREVTDSKKASTDAGNFTKRLLPKHALEAIQKIAGEARQAHYRLTLPWLDSGARILPAQCFIEYANAIRESREAFEQAARDFIAKYPSYIEEVRAEGFGLGGMFDLADYPTSGEIARSFDFSTRILPMPTAGDFRVEIGAAQEQEIRRSIEESTAEALAGAMREVWTRVADVVGKMAERLNAYRPAEGKGDKSEGVFRSSLVENVRDLVSILPALNLTGDAKLEAIRERMERELCAADAEELREKEGQRASTARAAESILAEVNDFLA